MPATEDDIYEQRSQQHQLATMHNARDDIPFFKLPPELRNIIYHMTLLLPWDTVDIDNGEMIIFHRRLGYTTLR